jgi:hypothetical protein
MAKKRDPSFNVWQSKSKDPKPQEYHFVNISQPGSLNQDSQRTVRAQAKRAVGEGRLFPDESAAPGSISLPTTQIFISGQTGLRQIP